MPANARLSGCAALLFLAGCGGSQPPSPPRLSFGGLPVSGSSADARAAGFTHCVELAMGLRCRKADVMLIGQGPYEAALDLKRRDGSGGFGELSLWHDTDQNALFAIGEALERDGWIACMTGDGDRAGDQKIWTRQGESVRISMDISYWGKRRLRVIPASNTRDDPC